MTTSKDNVPPVDEKIKNTFENEKMLQLGRESLFNSTASSSIPFLKLAVQNSTNVWQKAQAEVNLAIAYTENKDQINEGIELFKSISLNLEYPVNFRSTAAQLLIVIYDNKSLPAETYNQILSGPVWGDFTRTPLSTSKKVSTMDKKKAYAWIVSFDTSANLFFPAYKLANIYSFELLTATSTQAKHDLVNYINDYVARGDVAYKDALAINEKYLHEAPVAIPPFSHYLLGGALAVKAHIKANLFKAGEENITFEEVNKAYDDAAKYLEEHASLGRREETAGLYARYNHAQFLRNDDPVQNRDLIIAVLKPIHSSYSADPTGDFFTEYLATYANNPQLAGTSDRRDIIATANIDPLFKNLLMTLGWNTSDFDALAN